MQVIILALARPFSQKMYKMSFPLPPCNHHFRQTNCIISDEVELSKKMTKFDACI